jgi:hypothetical protein
MNTTILQLRRLAIAAATFALTCTVPSLAWCSSSDLWVSFYKGAGIENYTSKQLKKNGTPTPAHLSSYGNATGLAFDKSNNLWAVVDDSEVVEFTAAQLKNLKKDPNPTPPVVITSSSFTDIIGCNFDPQGNLWVVEAEDASIDELSQAQLAAGSAEVTPAVVITSSGFDFPDFITFDSAGDAWVDNEYAHQLYEFSSAQLTSGGAKSPTVVISDDGSETSLRYPGQIVFDQDGNLWVPNYGAATVVEYSKSQIAATGNPAPAVKLTSAVFEDEGPWAAAFAADGNLFIVNYFNGTIAAFTPKQLKSSGAPVPKVTVKGTSGDDNYQITFGPSS